MSYMDVSVGYLLATQLALCHNVNPLEMNRLLTRADGLPVCRLSTINTVLVSQNISQHHAFWMELPTATRMDKK